MTAVFLITETDETRKKIRNRGRNSSRKARRLIPHLSAVLPITKNVRGKKQNRQEAKEIGKKRTRPLVPPLL